jgi:hypothetical protein
MGTSPEGRDSVRRIVSNTGPLLHLSEAQSLNVLSQAGRESHHTPIAIARTGDPSRPMIFNGSATR